MRDRNSSSADTTNPDSGGCVHKDGGQENVSILILLRILAERPSLLRSNFAHNMIAPTKLPQLFRTNDDRSNPTD